MVERFTQGKIRWVNMKRPTVDEVRKVMRELDLPSVLLADATGTVPKNTVTRVDGTVKVTIDFPAIKRIEPSHQLEVKFFISKNSLLTIQYEEMEGIDRFRRQFEVASTLRKKQSHLTGAHLFISIFNHLYESTSSKLDYIESKLGDIESEIFRNNEKQMVFEISDISKKLIAFRHVIESHEDIFQDLGTIFESAFGKGYHADIHGLKHQFSVLERRANTQYKTMTALRETNSTMPNTKQNEILKIFTIMAFTTFPLTLFSSMFGMNTENTPLLGHPWDFWIIVSIMLLATVIFFSFFKHKGWM
jgi:magnesium transporter